MSARHIAQDVLLVLGVGAQIVCTLGVVLMRNVYDRLHYAAAGTTVGPILIGTAVLIRETISAGGLATMVTMAFVFLLGPVLTIATARAARRRDFGDVAVRPGERVDA